MKISLITGGFLWKVRFILSNNSIQLQTVLFISTDQLGKSVQKHSHDPQSDAIEYEKRD